MTTSQTEHQKNAVCLRSVADLHTEPTDHQVSNDVSSLGSAEPSPAHYSIPKYQRGYRWRAPQVEALLKDLHEFFSRTDLGSQRIYCLQPIVVHRKAGEEYWEVIDGQQRLTTLYLLFRYLYRAVSQTAPERSLKPLFRLSFETRNEDNQAFLEKISDTPELPCETIDQFHMREAYKTIDAWFRQAAPENPSKVDEQTFLGWLERPRLPSKQAASKEGEPASGHRNTTPTPDGGSTESTTKAQPYAAVIWYELPEEENPHDAFVRLNMGKIPLTESELIRALLLRRDNEAPISEESRQFRMAYEWDLMERALQNDAFWCFLSKDDPPEHNRIEILFRLVFESKAAAEEKKTDAPRRIFQYFAKQVEGSEAVDRFKKRQEIWHEVRTWFERLEDWYDDRRLFHLVGFLVRTGSSLINIWTLRESAKDGPAFDHALRTEIAKKIPLPQTELHAINAETIEEALQNTEYGSRYTRPLLLLFNIATLLEDQKSNQRFQFDRYHGPGWDIEHIHSVTPPEENPAQAREWLKKCREYLDEERKGENASAQNEPDSITNLICEIDELMLRLKDQDWAAASEEFARLHEKLLRRINGDSETAADANNGTDNSIANLAILDQGTNRSYKNAFFAVKRSSILALDQKGVFLPLCTRNVFLKAYTRGARHLLRWTTDDRDNYHTAMVNTLSKFFSPS